MKHRSLLVLSFLTFIIFSASVSAQTNCIVSSPNGRIKASLGDAGRLEFGVFDQEKMLMDVGINLTSEVDGKVYRSDFIKGKAKIQRISESIIAPNYRQAQFQTECNQMTVRLTDGTSVEVRAYNEGVAYRFVLPKAKRPEANKILKEQADIVLSRFYEPVCYMAHSTNANKPEAMAFQAVYNVAPMSQQNKLPAFLPFTLDFYGTKVTFMESDVEDYPGMFMGVKVDEKRNDLFTLHASFSKVPKAFDYYPERRQKYVTETEEYIAKGATHTPWRILAIAHEDKEMPTNNLVYALASPSRIKDTSWIRPGRAAWEWWNDWNISGVPFKAGINNDTYKHYIDFAAKYGLEYVVVDEGWYDPKSGDMLQSIPEIDLPMLVKYAKERNVRLILWTVFNVLDSQLKSACKKYADMGIAGFKVDFLDRNDQEAIRMTYRIAETCASHKLLLDYHGIYAPTGIQRTWPNVVNFEAVFGMEEAKWSKAEDKDMPLYDVTFPFIRAQAGYVDFTPGGMRNAARQDFRPVYSNPMTMGTRCHQMAHYIVHESPLTMLADNPTIYEKEKECTQFIASLPPMYESMRILDGKMGEYIVTLRTDKAGNYYVAGETNWDARSITVRFADFLPEGEYEYTLFADGLNAGRVATDYRVAKSNATNRDKLDIPLASGGGFAMKISRK